jgi:hypothetical protein
LDSRPKIRLAGDGFPKATGRAKQLMKNLPRNGCRKSAGEDFDFLQRSAALHYFTVFADFQRQWSLITNQFSIFKESGEGGFEPPEYHGLSIT